MNTFHAFYEETNLLSLSLLKLKNKKMSPLPYWVTANL